ncbi:DNA primase [Fusobacterium mortiferum]|uniref:DNA primase n=1 Tax=Fusobacterium mortiferum TaxID=850 RepID=A0ABS2G2X9_FUSMR|nr:DNA primase [Fusobacterium mortiferum]MBM6875771.1 DNA primase [Fusobacterium mortiferum]
MKYKTEDIDLLIDSLKIEEVVGEFVELKKAGANYKGLCPFHPDTTPSFMVSPSKNICKCFVCGAGGNPISFYSQYKKISFLEAIEELSKKYGIPIKGIDNNSIKHQDNYEKYYEIMREAHNFYKDMIFSNQGRVALEYLAGRKLNPKIIKENGLGFAPDRWSELNDYLLSKGYESKDLLKLGLIKEGENGNNYDVFRNRIMFPIYSTKGEVIAFGGRTLEKDKETPKYINSPDTPIFKKGKNLYGLERSGIIRKKNYAMLMEGYMDVLSAYIYGFDVALAPLGTALTEEQGILLKKYTSNIILSFDSDAPGQVATERAGLILKSLGFNIRILKLEGAKDPDEYLKQFGKESFLKCVKNSVEIFDFLFSYYLKEYDLSNMMSKQNFINRFKEFFQCVDTELEKTLYLDRLSKELEIEKDILKDILIDKNRKKSRKFEEDLVNINMGEESEIINRVEKDTVFLILANRKYFDYFRDKNIKGSLTKKIYQYLKSSEADESVVNIPEHIELTSQEMEQWQLIICSLIENSSNEKKIEELLKETFLSWFKQEIESSYRRVKSMDLVTGLMLVNKIKQLEIALSKTNSFDEIENMYKNFKEIIN